LEIQHFREVRRKLKYLGIGRKFAADGFFKGKQLEQRTADGFLIEFSANKIKKKNLSKRNISEV